MECYEGATMIKTFRGLLEDGGQDTILLHTNNGSIGYRIVKFETIGKTPGASNQESVTKIYKVEQATVDGVINFSDNRLLAAAVTTTSVDQEDFPLNNAIIFDNELFNQDIYITHFDVKTGESANYYIELEQVNLDLNENTVATLKDIRNIT
jgi:hypothetical protein